MFTYKSRTELSQAYLVEGDLVQVLGIAKEGDSATQYGLVRDNSYVTQAEIVSLASNNKVELFPAASSTGYDDVSNATVSVGSGTTSRTLSDRFSSVVNVKDYGAVGDGVTDDVNAFKLAFSKAIEYKLPLYIPSGDFLLKVALSEGECLFSLPEEPSAWFEVFGDGIQSRMLISYEEATWTAVFSTIFGHTTSLQPNSLIGASRGGYGTFVARDFSVKGSWKDGSSKSFGPFLFSFAKSDLLEVRNTHVSYWSNKWSTSRLCNSFKAINNEVYICSSDVFRMQGGSNCMIIGNKVQYADDDVVALHTLTTSDPLEASSSKMIVQGNIFEDSEGILILGGQSVIVSDNILNRCHGTCIAVQNVLSGIEGRSPITSVTIANNIITDTMSRRLASGDGFEVTSATNACIVVGLSPATAAASGTLVGYPNSSGVFERGWMVDSTTPSSGAYHSKDFSIQGSAGGRCITVSGNSITRTVGSGLTYSTIAGCPYIDRYGSFDPEVPETAFSYQGISIYGGDVTGFVISDNHIQGMRQNGIILWAYNSHSANWVHYKGGSIFNNVIIDTPVGLTTTETTHTCSWNLNISNNYFDCDPYHKHGLRNIDGSWNDTTSLTAPTGINLTCIKGVVCNNNSFSNCFIPIRPSLTSTDGTSKGAYAGTGNVIYCQPVSVNYDPSNKGVGNVGTGAEFTHIIYDADPTSTTYGVMNTTPQYVSALKPVGYYVRGVFIRNVNAGQAGTAGGQGWLRLTTGDGDVLGTDWLVIPT